MAIPDEDVAAVRQATDIVSLIGEYTPLKRQGRRFVGLCPFHSEKTGSFSVNGEEGLYYCFGCQVSGDAITFLRDIEGASFVEAVERLAARAGITVRDDAAAGDREGRDRRDSLYDAVAKAVAFYHSRLLEHPDASRARQYLRSRGLDGETVRTFKLGWAPETGSALVRSLRVRQEALLASGLAVEGRYGLRDSFRGRVIFPISQPDGKRVALGGRLVPGVGDGSGPKYRNSAESAIYQKRSTLYALNLARQGIVNSGEVIVCEGYTDVIAFFRAGLPRAVATCGTALTEDHFKLLARFGRRIVLAFDADKAGQSAATRFYEWEKKHDLEVAVAELPEGKDPADLASDDPDRLREAVSNARSYLEFRLRQALSLGELRTPEARAKAAEAALAVVAEHPNELVRDQYLMQVADATRIGIEQLRPLLARAGSERAEGTAVGPRSHSRSEREESHDPEPRPNASPKRRRATAGERAGRDALALAILEPAAMADRLDEVLFTDELQRAAFVALAQHTSLAEAIASSDEDVSRLLTELANTDPGVGPDQAVVALVRSAASQVLAELQAEVREAQRSGDDERLLARAPEVAWLKSEVELFMEVGAAELPPPAVTDAADRLVAWLAARRVEAI